jgi:kynurenine formamidase
MTSALLAAVEHSRVIDLGQPLEPTIPVSPNHPGFRMALLRRHGDMTRADGSSAANELIVTGGHVGTHIDALSHVSFKGQLHGGLNAAETQTGGRMSAHGAEQIEPIIRRGVLLDVARAHGEKALPGGYGITAGDLEAAAGVGAAPQPGDVTLIRTGWANNWCDPERYLGHDTGVPGLTVDAAEWLVQHRIVAAGGDTMAFEQIKSGVGHALLPVHRLLLFDTGVFIIENLDLESLSAEDTDEFLFVLSPLKIVGATGSPVRPLAVVTHG